MTPRCDGCRHWNRLNDGGGCFTDANFTSIEDDTGQCRRFPPIGNGAGANGLEVEDSGSATTWAVWPVTWDSHWCGEFAPRLGIVGGQDAA